MVMELNGGSISSYCNSSQYQPQLPVNPVNSPFSQPFTERVSLFPQSERRLQGGSGDAAAEISSSDHLYGPQKYARTRQLKFFCNRRRSTEKVLRRWRCVCRPRGTKFLASELNQHVAFAGVEVGGVIVLDHKRVGPRLTQHGIVIRTTRQNVIVVAAA